VVNILVGQRIKITAAIWDFCGTIEQWLYVNEVGINYYAQQDTSIECLNVSGIGVTFKLVGAGMAECHDCAPVSLYSILGVATTNSVGIVSIDHVVTDSDLSAYNDAITRGISLRVIACITDSKGQRVLISQCSDSLTVFQALQPTHYISLSMGFVPPELANYFQKYIVDISEQLFTKISYPPAPWTYVKTTYDPVKNAFNLWFYLPSTMSPDPLSDLFNWLLAWTPLIVGIILSIVGIALIFSGGTAALLFGIGGLYYVGAGVIILSLTLFTVISGTQNLQNTITNQGQQLSNQNKEEQGKIVISQSWEQSSKTQDDCLRRLQSYRELHNLIIDGNVNIFAKYVTLATDLKSEKESFKTTANGIITQFQGTPYSVDVCNTFYSNLDAAVTASNVRMSTLISQNVVPGEGYSPTCSGWGNQTDCEKAECFWYNSGCHKEPNCWIPNPIGGCILSAGTGTVIVGTIVLIAVGGAAYWLLTRHPAETGKILTSAKGAVTGEAERAKQAYRRIVPPPKPAPMPTPAPIIRSIPKQLLLPPAPTVRRI
jgi:hypothetical protein